MAELNDIQNDAVRDAAAILAAIDRGDVIAYNVILANCTQTEVIPALAAFALRFLNIAGIPTDQFIQWALTEINTPKDGTK